MHWDIFRAYDVGGIYPAEIDEAACYRIARGYTHVFRPKNILVGGDVRLPTPALKASVIRVFIDAGVDVIDIDPRVTTDMLYFAVGAYSCSGGVVVSASHNTKEYNGIKMVREGVTAISSGTGLFDIREALSRNLDSHHPKPTSGTHAQKDIPEGLRQAVMKFATQTARQDLN